MYGITFKDDILSLGHVSGRVSFPAGEITGPTRRTFAS
jgi:hypothetical protein